MYHPYTMDQLSIKHIGQFYLIEEFEIIMRILFVFIPLQTDKAQMRLRILARAFVSTQ